MAISTKQPIGVQFNDKFWSKVAVKEARKNIIFSHLGNKELQPKNYGDKLVKYHELPIIHPLNINDQGIDANGAKLVSGKWYAYDVNGAMIGNTVGYATKELAQAVVGSTSVKSGNGNLYGGDTDYSVVKGSFPALREEGGIVNAVGMKRLELEARVEEFGFHIPFTKKMLDMDTEKGLLARMSREIGVAQAELRERQVQLALVDAGMINSVPCGNASTIGEIGADDVLSFTSIRAMEQSLKAARSPKQTKMIDGSTKVGTVVVGAGYYAYVGQELYPTLEDMQHTVGGVAVNVWRPVESYASAGTISEYEVGKISATRFIEVEDMTVFKGAGADASASTGLFETNDKFDVFPVLYVGSDSFATVGFEGDSAQVQTAMPKIIPGVDAFGKNGLVSISWYFGALIYRPERIRMLLASAKLA